MTDPAFKKKPNRVNTMAKEMKIIACPKCGCTDLKWVGGGANALFDALGTTVLSGMSYCPRCDANIMPIEFHSKKGYEKFAKLVAKKRAQK